MYIFKDSEVDVHLGYVIPFFLKYTVIKGEQRGHLFKIWMKLIKTFPPILEQYDYRRFFIFLVLVGVRGMFFPKYLQ